MWYEVWIPERQLGRHMVPYYERSGRLPRVLLVAEKEEERSAYRRKDPEHVIEGCLPEQD